MNPRFSVTLLVLLFLHTHSRAQEFSFQHWHDGKVVLESMDTLKGQVQYDIQTDLLQLKINNHLRSYSPRKVLYFELFDSFIKQYRSFYSLPYSENNTYKTPVFFEFLTAGKITLLGREKLEYRMISNSVYFYGVSYTRLILVNLYYLLNPDGSIEKIEDNRLTWLTLMKDKEKEIINYSKTHNLPFTNKYDLIRIIEYYNSFFSK